MEGHPITPEEFAASMRALATSSDKEAKHSAMDALMCVTLISLGYREGVEVFENTDVWYA